MELTHLDKEGRAHMVDVGEKDVTFREAIARGEVRMKRETLELVLEGVDLVDDGAHPLQIALVLGAEYFLDYFVKHDPSVRLYSL